MLPIISNFFFSFYSLLSASLSSTSPPSSLSSAEIDSILIVFLSYYFPTFFEHLFLNVLPQHCYPFGSEKNKMLLIIQSEKY